MGDTTVMRARTGVIESSRIIGCGVQNLARENVGKIEDLVIDLREGRVCCAILSFGGFLGIGEKHFPVPLTALSYRADDKTWVMDVDKEALKNAPSFDKGTMPDLRDRDYLGGVYSHYGYEPYWH